MQRRGSGLVKPCACLVFITFVDMLVSFSGACFVQQIDYQGVSDTRVGRRILIVAHLRIQHECTHSRTKQGIVYWKPSIVSK